MAVTSSSIKFPRLQLHLSSDDKKLVGVGVVVEDFFWLGISR
jgi:hypothetical protein